MILQEKHICLISICLFAFNSQVVPAESASKNEAVISALELATCIQGKVAGPKAKMSAEERNAKIAELMKKNQDKREKEALDKLRQFITINKDFATKFKVLKDAFDKDKNNFNKMLFIEICNLIQLPAAAGASLNDYAKYILDPKNSRIGKLNQTNSAELRNFMIAYKNFKKGAEPKTPAIIVSPTTPKKPSFSDEPIVPPVKVAEPKVTPKSPTTPLISAQKVEQYMKLSSLTYEQIGQLLAYDKKTRIKSLTDADYKKMKKFFEDKNNVGKSLKF